MKLVLPHVEREGADPNTLAFHARTDYEDSEDVSHTLPYNPYGLVFFANLKVEGVPVPRFRRINGVFHMLADFAFKYYFDNDYETVINTIFPVGINRLTRAQVPVNRVMGNRAQMTSAPFQPENEPQQLLFELAAQGYQLPPPAIDNGSDMDVDSEVEEDNQADESIDEVLTKIWRCFLCDLLKKSPNPKSAQLASYCCLTKIARNRVKVGLVL